MGLCLCVCLQVQIARRVRNKLSSVSGTHSTPVDEFDRCDGMSDVSLAEESESELELEKSRSHDRNIDGSIG